jgi:hypothetical protein
MNKRRNTRCNPEMPNRSCRVCVTDINGIERIECFGTETLFEALGAGTLGDPGIGLGRHIPEGITTVTVCAARPQVEHCVKVLVVLGVGAGFYGHRRQA